MTADEIEMTADEMIADEMTADEMTVDEMSVSITATYKLSVDNVCSESDYRGNDFK